MTTIYREAGRRWVLGEELYVRGSGFQYFPCFAAFVAPLLLFPAGWAGVLFRLANLALFLWGTRRVARRVLGEGPRPLEIDLVSLAVAWTALKHGQSTLAMLAVSFLGLELLVRGRGWSAAWVLAFAVLLEPLALVTVGIAVVLHPRLAPRVTLTLLVGGALTLLRSDVGYAVEQWAAVPQMLLRSRRDAFGEPTLYHLFSLLGAWGVDVGPNGQTAARLVAAGLTVALALRLAAKVPRHAWPVLITLLSVGYLLLFSPRTENNTYGLLAPLVSAALAQARMSGDRGRCVAGWGIVLVLGFSRAIGATWPALGPEVTRPLITLAVVVLVTRQLPRLRSAESQVAIPPAHQGLELAVRDRAREHPEAAVGVHVLHPARPEGALGAIDRRRDPVGGLDVVDLDVDHADANAEARVDGG